MVKLVNRAKMTTTTTGTGAITLGSAEVGYQSFAAAGVVDGDVVRYVIEEGNNWEIGLGTYTASGTTLARTPTESSVGGTAITLTGSAVVFVDAAAADLVAPVGDALGTVTNNNLDLSTGNFFEVTANDQTLTFSNSPDVYDFKLILSGNSNVSPINLSTTTYDSMFFATGRSNPQGIAISLDGKKIYVVDAVEKIVAEVTLATAFDLNTSISSSTFSVSSQEATPIALAFSNDGANMYVAGAAYKIIFQYTLTTPFVLSSASYSNISFNPVAGSNVGPQGIFFNNSGSKMFIYGANSKAIYQFSLATPFNVSTASYDSISFSVSAQNPSGAGFAFNNDGTKMFVMSNIDDRIYQYDLTVGFDLTTASYNSISINIATQGITVGTGVAFSAGGEKMFVLHNSNKTIYRYSSASVQVATVTYPSSVKFPNAIIPNVPSLGEVITVGLYTVDGGINYYL